MDTAESAPSAPDPDDCRFYGDGGQPINSFALVAYIPDPLARFLDDLRRELVPACAPRAHVTILPPRPVEPPIPLAWDHIRRRLQDQPPIEIAAAAVEKFETTSVIYISLAEGRRVLERIHAELDSGPLRFREPYVYHPHITLAQELPPGDVNRVLDLAARRWSEYSGPRRCTVDTVAFVQNTTANRWIDLEWLHLAGVKLGTR